MPSKPPTLGQKRRDESRKQASVAAPHRKARAKLYNSARWKRMRKHHLMMSPLCVECGQPANVVDHIKQHNCDKVVFYDASNFQGLCTSCHNKKSQAERKTVRY